MTLQTLFLSLQGLKEQQFDCPAAERFGEPHQPGDPVSGQLREHLTLMHLTFNQCYTTQCDRTILLRSAVGG